MAKNLTVEEAEQQLQAAREAEVQRQREEAAQREREAQAEFDREQAKIVAALEEETEIVLATAKGIAESTTIQRVASAPARGFLAGVELGGGVQRLVEATRHDEAAAMLHAHFEKIVLKLNKSTINRPNGTRSIGPELADRLAVLERITFGAMYRRIMVLAGVMEEGSR